MSLPRINLSGNYGGKVIPQVMSAYNFAVTQHRKAQEWEWEKEDRAYNVDRRNENDQWRREDRHFQQEQRGWSREDRSYALSERGKKSAWGQQDRDWLLRQRELQRRAGEMELEEAVWQHEDAGVYRERKHSRRKEASDVIEGVAEGLLPPITAWSGDGGQEGSLLPPVDGIPYDGSEFSVPESRGVIQDGWAVGTASSYGGEGDAYEAAHPTGGMNSVGLKRGDAEPWWKNDGLPTVALAPETAKSMGVSLPKKNKDGTWDYSQSQVTVQTPDGKTITAVYAENGMYKNENSKDKLVDLSEQAREKLGINGLTNIDGIRVRPGAAQQGSSESEIVDRIDSFERARRSYADVLQEDPALAAKVEEIAYGIQSSPSYEIYQSAKLREKVAGAVNSVFAGMPDAIEQRVRKDYADTLVKIETGRIPPENIEAILQSMAAHAKDLSKLRNKDPRAFESSSFDSRPTATQQELEDYLKYGTGSPATKKLSEDKGFDEEFGL